ncbi:MAG: hypothetical protein QGI81_06725 [Pseudomonadales bacterium]|nr:methionyl-tRNA formyltransferase [SAR202 cluster bacterium]MDP6470677.1 hypothetical protein [Pseudomonadales bacterium]
MEETSGNIMDAHFVIAGSHPWSRRVFDDVIRSFPGVWTFIERPENLTLESLRRLQPRLVFFLHWSWKVPSAITRGFECVGFHMTDLPYGRGGTPLQNLILRGHQTTKLSAFRLTEDLDAGPVYMKADFFLDGSAEAIYLRACHVAADMIRRLIEEPTVPQPQMGDPVIFKRRVPKESRLPESGTPDEVYDFIRMLDAEGYPRAFLDHGRFRLEFRDAMRSPEGVTARVRVVSRQS